MYNRLFKILTFLFLLLFAVLCWHSRLATDDYYFIYDVRNNGILNNVYSQYMEWCGRFAANFLQDVVYKCLDVNQTFYFLYPFCSYILLASGIYFAFSGIFNYFKFSITISEKVVLVVSFTALLFFLSVDIGESWFWYDSLSSYLWSIVTVCLGIGFLLYTKNKIVTYIGIAVCFIYIGGSSELYSVIYGISFLWLMIYNWKKNKDIASFLREGINKKLIFLYTVLGISFIIFLIAPGNYLRDGLFPEHHFLNSFYITGKSIVKFFVLYLPFKLPYILIFSIPFLLIGKYTINKSSTFFQLSFKSFFIKTTLLFAMLLLIFFFMVAFVMVECGPPRVWFFVSFLLSIYCILIFFYAGYKGILNEKVYLYIKNIGLLLGFALMLFHLINQYSIISKYATAEDERIEYLKQLKNTHIKDSTIILKPLPPSGMLYSAEIYTDTMHFTNKELRLGFDLKFHVIRENKQHKE